MSKLEDKLAASIKPKPATTPGVKDKPTANRVTKAVSKVGAKPAARTADNTVAKPAQAGSDSPPPGATSRSTAPDTNAPPPPLRRRRVWPD